MKILAMLLAAALRFAAPARAAAELIAPVAATGGAGSMGAQAGAAVSAVQLGTMNVAAPSPAASLGTTAVFFHGRRLIVSETPLGTRHSPVSYNLRNAQAQRLPSAASEAQVLLAEPPEISRPGPILA